jgi:molecular chaperone Hsp33
MADAIVRAVAPESDLRFVAVKNLDTVTAIANLHETTGAMLTPLGHIITSCQLLATLLKGPGAVSMHIETTGVIPYMSADANPFGLARATMPKDLAHSTDALDTSKPLIGEGTLTIGKKLTKGGRPYRGIVELNSSNLALCVTHYLEKSEQVRSAFALSTTFNHKGVASSGGFMVQAFPGSKENALVTIEKTILALESVDQLVSESDDAEGIIRVLADGLDLEMMSHHVPSPYCPCSREGSETAVLALGKAELKKVIADGEELKLNCDYCRSRYRFTIDDLAAILKRGD